MNMKRYLGVTVSAYLTPEQEERLLEWGRENWYSTSLKAKDTPLRTAIRMFCLTAMAEYLGVTVDELRFREE